MPAMSSVDTKEKMSENCHDEKSSKCTPASEDGLKQSEACASKDCIACNSVTVSFTSAFNDCSPVCSKHQRTMENEALDIVRMLGSTTERSVIINHGWLSGVRDQIVQDDSQRIRLVSNIEVERAFSRLLAASGHRVSGGLQSPVSLKFYVDLGLSWLALVKNYLDRAVNLARSADMPRQSLARAFVAGLFGAFVVGLVAFIVSFWLLK